MTIKMLKISNDQEGVRGEEFECAYSDALERSPVEFVTEMTEHYGPEFVAALIARQFPVSMRSVHKSARLNKREPMTREAAAKYMKDVKPVLGAGRVADPVGKLERDIRKTAEKMGISVEELKDLVAGK